MKAGQPGGSVPGVPAGAVPLLARFRQLGPAADPVARAEVLRPLIRLIDPRVRGELAAALQGGLGSALAELGDRAGAGDYDEAIAAFEAAQELLAAAPLSRQRLSNAHQLGGILARRRTGDPSGNLEMAIRHLTEAADTGAVQLPPRARAAAQAGLAEVYLRRLAGQRADNVERAIGHLEAAAVVFTQQDFPAEWAEVCGNLGIAFRERLRGPREENLGRAIGHFQQVRTPKVRRQWPDAYAKACNGLGTAYLARSGDTRAQDIERAIGCYREAAGILAVLGRTVELAAARHNLGNAYLDRIAGNQADNIELAIGCLEDALRTRSKEAFPLDWAATRQAMGHAFLRRGRGERAQNAEQAIAALLDADGAFAGARAARQQALVQHSLAHAYFERVLGDRAANLAQVISCLRAALSVFRAEGMVAGQAAVLTGLGNAVSEQNATSGPGAAGRAQALRSAIGYHTQALAVLGHRATAPALWAGIQDNLGAACLDSDGATQPGNTDAAIAAFEEALAAGARTRSALQQAMTRYSLGVAYAARAGSARPGDLRAAVTQLTAALEVFTAVGISHHKRACGQALGDACTRLKDWPAARRGYAVALDAADDIYVSSLRLDAAEAQLGETHGLHPRAAYAAARAGDVEQAVALLERGRARGLGDALARDAAQLRGIRALDAGLAGAFLAAAREVRDLEGRDWLPGASLSGRGAGGGTDDDLRRQFAAARAHLDRAVARIRRLKGHHRFLVQPGFGDVAAAAATAGPLAYLAVTDAGSLTLLVRAPAGPPPGARAGRPGVELVAEPAEPLTSGKLGTLLAGGGHGEAAGGYLPAQMAMGDSPGEFASALEALLPVLGGALAAPLAAKLAANRIGAITLIACGLLGLLPLHAATYQRDGADRCLLDDCAVCYAPSARVLAAAHSALAARPAGIPVLAGGGDPAGGDPAGDGTLPFARAELEELSARFPAPRTFYGGEATKAALLEAAAGATHVHLACHGLFNPVTPRDSALVLAGEAGPAPLTVGELLAARPFARARLVVASACETAFTDFTDFTDFTGLPDETIGLPAGFLQAGTPAVVGTLWMVRDVSTALLMIRFYEYLLDGDGRRGGGPLPPGQALRLAQLWLARATADELAGYLSRHPALAGAGASIAGGGRRPFAHPCYWAPFMLVGAGN